MDHVDSVVKKRIQPRFVRDFMKEVKEEMKCSQIELSRCVGISKSHMSDLMTGNKNPSMNTIADIADSLGMKPVLCLMDIED